MDQDAVVREQTESGEQLIEALVADGFDIRVAFWAKPTDDGKWFLYLASPRVDDTGPAAAYRFVHGVLRKMPDLWIDPLEIKVVGLNDSLTEAALAAIKPKVPNSPYAVQNPKPFRGLTVLGETTFGGISIDRAYIYPPLHQGASA
jgi:hypothetical protein